MGAVDDYAERLRSASADAREQAYWDLLGALRPIVALELRRGGVLEVDLEELTEAVATKAADWIASGDVAPGKEKSFVRSCARNRSRSYQRSWWIRKRTQVSGETPGSAPPPDDDPEAALDRDKLLELLPAALAAAPAAYRGIVEQVYLHEREINAIADEELAQSGESGEEARRRARNNVDRRLSRARRWLRRKLEGLQGGEDEES